MKQQLSSSCPLKLDPAVRMPVLRLLFRPLARFCVRHSLLIQECLAALRIELIEAAQLEIRRLGQKPTASHINLITGIYREEVPRIIASRGERTASTFDVLVNVIGRWEQDLAFTTRSGRPRVLSCRGASSDFYKLVAAVSRNASPPSVLFALERLGAIEVSPRGAKLCRGGAAARFDPEKGFGIFSRDVETLLDVVEWNLSGADPRGMHHIRTEYDNIPEHHLPEIKEWFHQQGRLLHKRARHFLSKFDRDLNPKVGNAGGRGRAVLQSFGLVVTESSPAERIPPGE